MNKGILAVISSPSGGGKSTLVRELIKRKPDVLYSVSCTTRAPRRQEKDGLDYHFITKEEFEKKRNENAFLEWAHVHGSWYGTPRDFVENSLSAGRTVILDIDVQGGKKIKSIIPDAALIFIAPPSMEDLELRLKNRKLDDEDTIRKRLQAAQNELAEGKFYDYLILNHRIDNAVEEFISILTAESLRMSRKSFPLMEKTALK